MRGCTYGGPRGDHSVRGCTPPAEQGVRGCTCDSLLGSILYEDLRMPALLGSILCEDLSMPALLGSILYDVRGRALNVECIVYWELRDYIYIYM